MDVMSLYVWKVGAGTHDWTCTCVVARSLAEARGLCLEFLADGFGAVPSEIMGEVDVVIPLPCVVRFGARISPLIRPTYGGKDASDF